MTEFAITVHILKPGKGKTISYRATLLERSETLMLVYARWKYGLIDMEYFTFAPGDHLFEYFYADRWYNVYEILSAEGDHKGWYCNITRPAVFGDAWLESEDIELDLYVSPDRQTVVVLDEDEFEARGLEASDPPAYRASLAALHDLQAMARRGEPPFCIVDRRTDRRTRHLWEE